MLKQKQNFSYNPESFIQLEIRKVLPDTAIEVINIDFSGYLQKWFHTGNRPVGFIEITYKDQYEGIKKEKLFIKIHNEAEKAFNSINKLYKEINNEQVINKIPKPIICDYDNNAMFFQYVEGIPLNQYIARRLLYKRSAHTTEIACTLKEVGGWLSCFHEATKIRRTTTLSSLTAQITDCLRGKNDLNNNERNILENTLNMHANVLDQNELLAHVQTHKDFNLRNVFIIDNKRFHVIDWDAMVHSEFRNAFSIWVDVTKFTISIKSLTRFRPVLSRKIVNNFLTSFLKGYFGDRYQKNNKEFNYLLWTFTLLFFIGLIADRSLPDMYTNILGNRFISDLKENLLSGPSAITSV